MRSAATYVGIPTSSPFFSLLYREFLRRDRSLLFALVRPSLLLLSLIYLAVVEIKRAAARPRRFPSFVVSIGNITAGGTGKTTLTVRVARLFLSRGIATAVVAGGIARSREPVAAPGSDAARGGILSGDEILLIGEKLPDALVVRGRGKASLVAAATRHRPEVIVVDDGFHCHGIRKDMDIVLLDAFSPFDNGLTVPAGLMRERRAVLSRADGFVITHASGAPADRVVRLTRFLERFGRPVFRMDYDVTAVLDPEGRKLRPDVLRGRKILALAGIGNPWSFFSMLSRLAGRQVLAIPFPDHFPYRDRDVAQIEGVFRRCGADMLITTEKDRTKLKRRAWNVPLHTVEIACQLEDLAGDRNAFDKWVLATYNLHVRFRSFLP